MTKSINYDLIDTNTGKVLEIFTVNNIERGNKLRVQLNKKEKQERYIITTINHYEP